MCVCVCVGGGGGGGAGAKSVATTKNGCEETNSCSSQENHSIACRATREITELGELIRVAKRQP